MTESLFTKTYAAFNARDIDTVLSVLDPDVDWENGMEGGRVHGHDGVRAYWERQFTLIEGRVEPEAIEELPDGRVSIYIVNPRNDEVRVYLKARKRTVTK